MKVLDFRITLFGLTFFLGFLCQYLLVFYFLMVAACAPGFDLFSFTIKSTRKKAISILDLFNFFTELRFRRFQRWKLIS